MIQTIIIVSENKVTYLLKKEDNHYILTLKLYINGIITTLKAPFEALTHQKIKGLIATNVIISIKYDNKKYIKIHVFKLKFINEIKNKFNK